MKSPISTFSLLMILMLFQLPVIAQSFEGCPTGKEKIPSSNEAYEQRILELVNKERAKKNLQPVVWSEELMYAARFHAKDMIVDRYFEHDMYDRKRWRLKKVCGTFEKMDLFITSSIFSRSENIGAGMESPEEMVSEWMDSPGHRENILDPESKYMGAAYIYDEDSEYGEYWVQCFGM